MVLWLIFLVLLLVMLFGIIGISWYISKRLLHRTGNSLSFRLPATDMSTTTITLQKTANTKRPGVFGITGIDGQAIVGPLLSFDTETVTREIIHATHLFSDTKVAWNTTVYGGMLRSHLALTITDVLIPGVLGDMPAWFVSGKHTTWAILVHGATGTREQCLRAFQTLAGLGLPILAITYRNDEGAPASSDGLSHFGETEWQDLEASVTYALAQGAERIILYGWSMGGTTVELFLARSLSVSAIQAVVLDSPVLNWRATLAALVKKNSLPAFIAEVTEKIISLRTGVRFAVLDQRGHGQRHIPTLFFHGINDTTAPIAISDAFVAENASITYHRISEAEHTQCWNANPEKYEAELRSFLTQVVDGMAL